VLDDDARDYVSLMLDQPEIQEWTEAAKQEPWIIPEFER